MPKISVILPVYNAEDYIYEAVQSILAQTFKDFELIILNDCSTDNTISILKLFNDERILLIHNEVNLKVVKSLNKGLEIATGEYIARMDADDISHPHRFEKQLQYFKQHPNVDFCGTWIQHFGKEESILKAPVQHEHIKASMLFLNPIFHPSVMFKKDSFKKYGFKYDELYTNAEDYGLWAKAIDKIRFANLPEVLLKYRIHGANVSVLSEVNGNILDKIHYSVYEFFCKKLNVSYNSHQLVMHRKLALTKINNLRGNELIDYLKWIETLVDANNKTAYFQPTAFRDTIISYYLLIGRRAKYSSSSILNVIKTGFKIYSLFDYCSFFMFKIKTRLTAARKF